MNLDIKHSLESTNHEVVHLIGEIDAFTAPKLKETLFPLVEKEGLVVKVDLSEVNYIDSTGLGIFVGAYKSSHNSNSKLQLIGLNERVYRLFSITGLDEIIDIVPEKKEGAR
ncbi:positive regulator of sigma-B activity [Alkalihalobacillus alcalophilus ATCC 27647 = CGMCC 1.3604]|uniref:Anti-sigma factor antagonist n=1 Tax=Alkalihalobacillus alcalophilus ATCC 27647 = CGMCC 1.3604 TaxID=1218173 RepID=A0A094WHE4_ALKAL|nr:STAS domain-containing protein [Alkalihalobacillus alcalophilus]KGA96211.1 anti-sigma-factor antagonist [Alkalihalobacillus alcalophilus ATCC 27647 = CGMCC 1.3604]MED1563009.1 STAS domain-containing protein [Alkalihalobacillus alcalophilus]THG92306.1 positive regulator of sigma-B activity [Alkalihalobacillus alcalophilus ATCC 27647 = CGMCC 1.3604]